MRIFAQTVAAFLVMAAVGALWRVLPLETAAPFVPVVYAVYLGITTRERLPVAIGGAILIGYLWDLFSGSPRGLFALTCGLVCVAARPSSARLLVRGRLVIASFVGIGALGAALLLLLLRLLGGLAVGGVWAELVLAVTASAASALLGPPIFLLCRRLDAAFARTEREREAIREGYLA